MGSLAIRNTSGRETSQIVVENYLAVVGLTVKFRIPTHALDRQEEMKITANMQPDGTVVPLIWIKDWNFYWQDSYVYSEPVHLPEGTRLEIEAYYDNSAENPIQSPIPAEAGALWQRHDERNVLCGFSEAVADDPSGMRAHRASNDANHDARVECRADFRRRHVLKL